MKLHNRACCDISLWTNQRRSTVPQRRESGETMQPIDHTFVDAGE
jgi:hypothetical protein